MEGAVNRRWLLKERPVGPVGPEHFQRVEEAVPEPGEGQFLVRVTHLSFDPTQRGRITGDTYIPAVAVGAVMRAKAVGEVVASRRPEFPVGARVQGGFGWQDYALSDGRTDVLPTWTVPDDVSAEEILGVLGLTGMTAYFGLSEIGKPKAGETVLVSAAAGATGSIAVQLAKQAGCRVIGIAGGPEKCAWVVKEAGADACIDYKSQNVWWALGKLAPEGVDVVFENVGGEILEAAITRLALHARIIMCGAISTYDADPHAQKGIRYLLNLAMKRARIEGFIVLDYEPRYDEAMAVLTPMLRDGRLKSLCDVQEGFENIPATFMRLFAGKNFGKQLLKL